MTLLDTVTPPTSTAAERADRLTAAGAAWGARIAADTAAAQLTYKVRGRGEGSVASLITAGKHSFLVDEPAALAGDDVAASPVEFALGALISCQIVVYRLYAQALGIQVGQAGSHAVHTSDYQWRSMQRANPESPTTAFSPIRAQIAARRRGVTRPRWRHGR